MPPASPRPGRGWRSRARTTRHPARRAPRARRRPARPSAAPPPPLPSPGTGGRRAPGRAELDEDLVALGRVHDQVGVVDDGRPVGSPREPPRVRAAPGRGGRPAAVSEDDGPLRRGAATIAASVDAPSIPPARTTSVFTDSGLPGPQRRAAACLCGLVTFAPTKPSAPRPARVGQAVRRGRERHVRPVEPERGEGRVLHSRRERVLDGPAEDADEPRRPRDPAHAAEYRPPRPPGSRSAPVGSSANECPGGHRSRA